MIKKIVMRICIISKFNQFFHKIYRNEVSTESKTLPFKARKIENDLLVQITVNLCFDSLLKHHKCNKRHNQLLKKYFNN